MHWGKAGVMQKSDPNAVFNPSNAFTGVWHLDDNAASCKIRDASDRYTGAKLENNGAQENTSVRSTPGIADGAIDFIGSNRITLYNFIPVQNENEFTVSAWVYADNLTNLRSIWFTPELNAYGKVRLYGNVNWNYENGTGAQNTNLSAVSTAASWVHLAATQRAGNNIEFFVNGVSVGTKSYPTKGTHANNSYIGAEEWSNYFDGKIDEVTFSKAVRSSDWIKLWYESQKPSQKFLLIGNGLLASPSGFTANLIGNDISLSWVDNADNETGYQISKRIGTSLPLFVAIVGANLTSFTDPDISCSGQIVYMLKAINNSLESSIVESNEVYAIPCKPLSLSASHVSESEVLLTWDANGQEYVLEAKLQTSSTYSEIYRGPEKSFLNQGVACQSAWNYRLKAVNPEGSSEWFEIAFTTGACALTSPTNFTADFSVPDQVTLYWDDLSTDEDGFKVYRKMDGEGNFSEIGTVVVTDGRGVFVDNTVICNTPYSYYITAYTTSSVSAASPIIAQNTLYCGAGKTTSEMITIKGMYLDANGNPVTGTKLAVVKLFNSTEISSIPVYEESFIDIKCKNGYFSIPLGLTGDVISAVRNYNNLYYDVIIDGVSVFESKAQPLTASPYSIKNSFNLAGNGSPANLEISAPVGATWVDVIGKVLYVKYGEADTDWERFGN